MDKLEIILSRQFRKRKAYGRFTSRAQVALGNHQFDTEGAEQQGIPLLYGEPTYFLADFDVCHLAAKTGSCKAPACQPVVWGITPSDFEAAKPCLRGLLQKVETGQDLTPHLSYLVDTKGVILPGASPADKGKDLDAVLTRYGMHHFHVGEITLQNPKGRSGVLVFAEVADSDFRIVAIADHHAFTLGTVEQQTLSRICTAYCTRDIPRGSGFMLNPVMSSGHSAIIMMFGMKCKAEIERLDPLLDDASFVDQLYSQRPILRDGQTVGRPAKPSLGWHFNDLAFGILDRKTMVFFNLFPYFAR